MKRITYDAARNGLVHLLGNDVIFQCCGLANAAYLVRLNSNHLVDIERF